MRRACLLAFSLLTLMPAAARADVLWQWSFATEAGTFITNDDFSDTLGNNTFTILDFTVTSSSVPANVGAVYEETQPVQGFNWDGAQVTEFFRANGVFTNGSNFFHPTNGLWYGFVPLQACLNDAEEQAIFCDGLTLTPVADVPVAPAWLLSALAAVLLAWGTRSVARLRTRAPA